MFIPVITTPPPPSPEAQELALRLAQLVRDEGRSNPRLVGPDVERAFQLARTMLRPEYPGRCAKTPLMVALGVGLAVLAGAGVLFLKRMGGDAGSLVSSPMLIMGVIVLLGALVAAVAMARRAG